MNECEWLSMDAKIVQHDCISCNERMEIDFNVDDYSSEITIVNGTTYNTISTTNTP